MNKNFFIFFVLAVFTSLGGGFYLGKTQSPTPPIAGVINIENGKPHDVDFSLFWDAWRILQEKYVDSKNLDYESMVHGAIAGMLKGVGDPYTVFMDPGDTTKFFEELEGSFEGVGMEIGRKEGELRVIAPVENSPAKRAGIREGDRIFKIEDTFTTDITTDEAVSLIRGPKGTKVKLLIWRKDWTEPKEFIIERDIINIPALKWELKEETIAYIRIFQFSEKAASEFQKVVPQISSSGAKQIIIDVRNNPGGFLDVAVDLAGWFIEKGEIVVVEDFGEGEAPKEYKSKGNGRLKDYPVVVLINEGSASASEILAGALRDHNDTLLIGQKSFGKGSVQELQKLPDGSSVKVTVARWFTPKGNLITSKGLEPNIEIEYTEEDRTVDRDPQLEKAIEILHNL